MSKKKDPEKAADPVPTNPPQDSPVPATEPQGEGIQASPPADSYVPPPKTPPPPSRVITTHHVNEANGRLSLEACDEPGPGGANHAYVIGGFKPGSNPSLNALQKFARDSETDGEWMGLLFQNGGIAERGVNGLTHEVLLAILIDRLSAFQQGQYACDENRRALVHLKMATVALADRTKRRSAAGVEGTMQKDPEGTAWPSEPSIEQQLAPLIERLEKLHEADKNDVAYSTIRGHLHTALRWAEQRTAQYANQANVTRK